MKFENVIVFGLGAVGSNIMLNLIRDLPNLNYIGVDYDKVEERNIAPGTQPYLKSHIGKYKTQSLQMLCLINANKKIAIITNKIGHSSDIYLYAENTLAIDAFDNLESRNLIKGTHVVHVGFSPEMTGSVIWDHMWKSEKSSSSIGADICTMQGARSFIMALTSLASMVIVEFYYKGTKDNLYFDKYFKLKKLI